LILLYEMGNQSACAEGLKFSRSVWSAAIHRRFAFLESKAAMDRRTPNAPRIDWIRALLNPIIICLNVVRKPLMLIG